MFADKRKKDFNTENSSTSEENFNSMSYALHGAMKESISLWIKTEDGCDIQQPIFSDWQTNRPKHDDPVFYDPFNYSHRGTTCEDERQKEAALYALKAAFRQEGQRFARANYLNHYAEHYRENVEEMRPLPKRRIHSTSSLSPTYHHSSSSLRASPQSAPENLRNSPDIELRERLNVSPIVNVTSRKRCASADSLPEDMCRTRLVSPKVPSPGSSNGAPPCESKTWEENIEQLRVKLAAHFQELKKCSTMNIQRLTEGSDASCSSDSDNENSTQKNSSNTTTSIRTSIPISTITRTNIPSPSYSSPDDNPHSPEDTHTRPKGQIKEKLFKCELCPKAFTQKCNLTKHIRVHTNEKPYQCQYCDKAFTQKAYLVPHLRTHTNEKPFECSHCGKAFTQKHDLTKHIRIHTNVRPYACTFCDKAFVQKSALTSHIRTHTKEKPFACSYCSKAFNQKYDLTKHIRTHTKEKSFSCSSCQKAFSRKDYFNIHKKLCSKLAA